MFTEHGLGDESTATHQSSKAHLLHSHPNTAIPQRCVLSSKLHILFTYDSFPICTLSSTAKFADDTTIIVLISSDDENTYKLKVESLLLTSGSLLLGTSP